MTKKIFLIIGILIVIGAAAYFMWEPSNQSGEGDNRVGFSIRDFLPFGKSDDIAPSTQGQTPTTDNGGESIDLGQPDNSNQPVPKLRKLSKEPVAGATIFNTSSTSVVRFVEKGTGNVYEAKSDSNQIERLTNTTIPKIIRAFWLPNGSGFLAQTIMPESEIIETNFIKLNKNITSTPNDGSTPFDTVVSKLPTGIKEIAVKPDGGKIFYYTVSGSQSNWFIGNPDGTQSTALLSHPLSEWVPKWVSPNQILLQTKSSSKSLSYPYVFDLQNKILKKAASGMAGLSFNPNPDWSLALASSGGALPQLYMLKSGSLAQINVSSFAEKCVWSKEKSPTVFCAIPNSIPKGNYPDAWYMGTKSTEDSISKIDINNSIYLNISDLSTEGGEKIDVIDPQISADESYLIFRNKIDGFLWMLRLRD